jgi:hypothetical protein
MNAAGFWRGVGLAMLLSIVGAAAFALVSPLLGIAISLRLLLLAIASGCVVDTLLRNPGQPGRLLAAAVWLLIAGALLLFNPPLWLWLAVAAGYLWLLRSLRPSGRPLHALLDAAIVVVGLAAASASLRHSGSLLLALWCFLLLQAVASALSAPKPAAVAASDRFSVAQRNAETALRTLLDPRSVH